MSNKERKQKTKIDYISGPPGVGKTSWALVYMAKRLLRGESFIYAAPTIRLLKQVRNDLHAELVQRGDSSRKAKERLVLLSSDPGSRTNFNVRNRIESSLENKPIRGSRIMSKSFGSGRVMFLTHIGFATITSLTKDGFDLSNVQVIYDEARKMVMEHRPLRLKRKQLKRFNSMLEFKQYKDSDYYRLRFKAGVEVDKVVERMGMSGNLIYQSRTLIGVVESISNEGLETFVTNPEITQHTKYYVTNIPSQAFAGYKRVTLMAAFFEESQMYHLLKSSKDTKLRDVTKKIKGYKNRIRNIEAKYRRMRIVPLTPSREVHSIRTLQGIMLQEKGMRNIAPYIFDSKITNEDLFTVGMAINSRLKIGGKGVGALKSLKKKLEKQDTTIDRPIEWFLSRAAEVVRGQNRLEGSPAPLVFVNNAFVSVAENHPFKSVSMISHGLNTYANHDIAIFLAAINPNVRVANFMKIRLGEDYDHQKDYVLDMCLQSICRTNVRNLHCRKSTLVIVPDMRMALMLQDRLGLGSNGKPLVKIDKSYMQKILPLRMPMVMQYLSKKQLRQLRDERREKAEERKQAAKAKAALPMTRLLSTWSVQRTRSRSTMDAAPEREAARIRRIDKLFEAFAQVRDYLADAPIEVQEKAVAEARTYPRIEVYSDKCKPQEPIPLLVHAGLEELPKDLTTVKESVFANIPFEKRPKELPIVVENVGKTRKGKPKKRK